MKQYLTALVLGIGLVGCTSSDRAEVRQESREAGAEARTQTAEAKQQAAAKRREYQERWQTRLDKIDREMDEERAKVKGRKLTAKQRAEYNERMAELDTAKKETRDKWEQVKGATDENWEQFKDALDRAGDKFENGWNRFVADMKS
jgi:DNA repair exonuclease SbcCD ATPase subunit